MSLVTRVRVHDVDRISPSFTRVALGGAELAHFGVDGPTFDQRIKLLFPAPDRDLPDLDPDTWWQDFQALPEDERGSVRTYTIRDVLGSGDDTKLVVDFVVHPGAHGPGSHWAEHAEIGDEILAVVPRKGRYFGGIEWDPGDARQLLIVGDETAVPAVCSIVESLPADARGDVFLEVPESADVQPLSGPSGVSVHWLPRDGVAVGERIAASLADHLGVVRSGDAALAPDEPVDPDFWETPAYSSSGESVSPAEVPLDGHYAWIAGESAMVKALRRRLVKGLGLARSQVAFMGYWRIGVSMRA